jgi:hypothetical protein
MPQLKHFVLADPEAYWPAAHGSQRWAPNPPE